MGNGADEFTYLAAPARRALAGAGIHMLADLGRVTESDLAALHGMGPNAIRRLCERMAEQNIRFAEQKD